MKKKFKRYEGGFNRIVPNKDAGDNWFYDLQFSIVTDPDDYVEIEMEDCEILHEDWKYGYFPIIVDDEV